MINVNLVLMTADRETTFSRFEIVNNFPCLVTKTF